MSYVNTMALKRFLLEGMVLSLRENNRLGYKAYQNQLKLLITQEKKDQKKVKKSEKNG